MNAISKSLGVIVLAAAVTAVVGCGRSKPPPDPSLRVRLLTSLTVSGRWERAAERGLGLIAAELDADVARSRASGAADQRSRLQALARAGVDLVFCVGPDVEAMIYTEATAYPDTTFVIIPGEVHRGNVAGVVFMPEEAGYLAGAVAAAVTDGDSVGLLRGSGRPWLERLEAGFLTGFRSRRPNAAVATATGPDGAWQLAASGIEVALYSTDAIDRQVLSAVHDAGLHLVAADPDLLNAEPDFVVAAVEVDVAEAMLRVAREVDDGTFIGKVFAFDLGSGVLDVVLNPGWAPPEHDTDLREILEQARSEITAGWIEIEELGIGL